MCNCLINESFMTNEKGQIDIQHLHLGDLLSRDIDEVI